MTKINLKPITLTPDDLLLDPNNPRLAQVTNHVTHVPDEEIEDHQERIRGYFTLKRGKSEDEEAIDVEEATDITNLYESMIRIGYVSIDRIVVRQIPSVNKYVVIEGNRRVSTIKLIRDRAAKGQLIDGGNDSERKKYESVKESLEELKVLELRTTGLSKSDVERQIDVILGLRHFGSVLDWKPLNRAFNILKNYLAIEPPLDSFRLEPLRLKDVASRLSISKGNVKKALETLVVFMQLRELAPQIREEHYSLVEQALPLKRYNQYFVQDAMTFAFDATSLEKLLELCQFEERNLKTNSDGLIISDPKQFGVLGKILKISVDYNQPSAIRHQAANLAEEVRRGEIEQFGPNAGKLVMPVDKAYSLLKAEMVQREWVATLLKKLDKQESELPFEKYDGTGNHLMKKNQLEQEIRNHRRMFGL